MMQPRRREVIILILIGLTSGASGILGNIASSQLPEIWKPYLWIAWPLFGISTMVGIVLAITGATGEPNEIVKHTMKIMRGLGILVIMPFSLVVPLIPLQWLSLYLTEYKGQAYSVAERVDLYANTYALLSLTWGSIWAYFLSRRLYHWLNESGLPKITKDKAPQ